MKLIGLPLGLSTLLLLGGGLASAQVGNPQATRAAGVPTLARSNAPAIHAAQVVFSGGQLTVLADNSSLNQVLHEIARVTGMTITGSVADGRVFGKYGPGAATVILNSLLDGTGVNMLLKETASGAPAELILTPRNGPPTPPNPAAQETENVPAARPAAAALLRVGDPGTEGVVVLDINGNPAPVGAPIPPPPAPPMTQEQRQQQMQQLQQLQQQQAMQQRQREGH